MQQTNVIAVIVVFKPNLEVLKGLILASLEQVDRLVIVNNSPEIDLYQSIFYPHERAHLINLHENMGIAYAQNIGIEWAISQNAAYVLLHDQDSTPSENMVRLLTQNLSDNPQAIAVGPQYEDSRTGVKSRFMTKRFGLPHRYLPKKINNNQKPFVAQFLISSGCLIHTEFLLKIGGMRSSYFIDHVDTEWCLRAIEHGYILLGNPSALMKHSLGDQAKKVWFIYMRNVTHHSPLRDYYMFRNTLLMLRDTKIDRLWQAFLLFRLLQFLIYFPLFSTTPAQRLKMMWLGIKHGLQNQRGRLDPINHCCISIPVTLLDELIT